jgi:putative ABC transport system permease protein
VEQELDEELRSHLQHEIEKCIKAGMSQREAVRRAHLALGGLDQVKEHCRDARGTRWVDEFTQDLRYAFRLQRRSPTFALAAFVSLSLGIGAVTAVFSIINAVWLRPLPVADPSRVVRVYSHRAANVSAPDMTDFRNATTTLEGLVGFAPTAFSVTVGDVPTRVFGELVSGDFFDVLGIRAAEGRTFLPHEGRDPGSAPIAVISHVCWQRVFGGDPTIVGRNVRVNGQPFVVIGVLPADVRGMLPPMQSDMWVPLTMEPILKPGSTMLENRDAGRFHLLGRLRPGAGVAQAQAELSTIARDLERRYPETNRGRTVSVYPARPLVASFETPVLAVTGLLMALAAGLLLTAGVNIGSLLLARATERRAENGLRLALGATRWRLVRQHLLESLLLAGAGAAGGTLIAIAATRALRVLEPPTPVPVGLDVRVDAPVALCAVVGGAFVTLVMGLVPAIRSSRQELITGIRDGGSIRSAGGARLRTAFVVLQIALSVGLAGSAGLLGRSAFEAAHVDLGFQQDDVWALSVDLETRPYSPEQGRLFYRNLQRELEGVSGIGGVTLAATVPLTLSDTVVGLRRSDSAATAESSPVHTNAVSPGYFATLGIRLLAGRDFDARDTDGRPPVAVVNETLARRFWPGESAIGKRVRHAAATAPEIEIVGVARNSKYTTAAEEPEPFAYLPLAQAYVPRATILFHAAPGMTGALAEARRTVRQMDPNLAIYNANTLSELTAVSRLPATLAAGFAGVLAAVALGLAGFGTFTLLAFVVTSRSREVGIRVALGAGPTWLLREILQLGARWMFTGQLLGLGLALGAGQALRSTLYGVGPGDPAVVLVTLLLSTLCSALACLLPALRMLQVDPVRAIRQE